MALEEELDKIDLEESRLLFHGSRRRDRNGERRDIMQTIEKELAQYGTALALSNHEKNS